MQFLLIVSLARFVSNTAIMPLQAAPGIVPRTASRAQFCATSNVAMEQRGCHPRCPEQCTKKWKAQHVLLEIAPWGGDPSAQGVTH